MLMKAGTILISIARRCVRDTFTSKTTRVRMAGCRSRTASLGFNRARMIDGALRRVIANVREEKTSNSRLMSV